MARINISAKHIQVNKANTMITAALAIASFVAVASLVGIRTMLQQRTYQSNVIEKKEVAADTLKDNIAAVEQLVASYQEFVDRPINIIGGSADGTADNDGDNAKIVLDALPSKYDFPAIATSLEKILTQSNFTINSISGIDDEIAQNTKENLAPEVVEIPFSFAVSSQQSEGDVTGGYDTFHNLILKFENSIRPIKLKTIRLTVGSTSAALSIEANTFYQSEQKLNITTEVVR